MAACIQKPEHPLPSRPNSSILALNRASPSQTGGPGPHFQPSATGIHLKMSQHSGICRLGVSEKARHDRSPAALSFKMLGRTSCNDCTCSSASHATRACSLPQFLEFAEGQGLLGCAQHLPELNACFLKLSSRWPPCQPRKQSPESVGILFGSKRRAGPAKRPPGSAVKPGKPDEFWILFLNNLSTETTPSAKPFRE